MIKTILLTVVLIVIITISDKLLYQIAYSHGGAAANQKWRNELIEKNYAGYVEKTGNWEYLKETDVLLRLLIKYNDNNPPIPPPAKKELKLEMNNEATINEKNDFLAENDKPLIMPPKTKKK